MVLVTTAGENPVHTKYKSSSAGRSSWLCSWTCPLVCKAHTLFLLRLPYSQFDSVQTDYTTAPLKSLSQTEKDLQLQNYPNI